MQNQAKAIQAFLLTHIPKHPGHVVTMTMEKFGVSRTTVLTHLKKLIEANQVIRTGTTKQTLYSLVGSARQQFSFSLTPQLLGINLRNICLHNFYLKSFIFI